MHIFGKLAHIFGKLAHIFGKLAHVFAWKLVSRTWKQVSRNLGPLWQPGVYNDTNARLLLEHSPWLLGPFANGSEKFRASKTIFRANFVLQTCHPNLVSASFSAHNSGAGNGCANFMGAWHFSVLSAGKPPCYLIQIQCLHSMD